MKDYFSIQGQRTLSGSVQISGSKNASLPLLAATLAIPKISTLHNIPDISDIHSFCEIISSIGGVITREGTTLHIDSRNLTLPSDKMLTHSGITKMRASILLLSPLLLRFGEIKMAFPGGCVLGKRSATAHLRAFEMLGAEIVDSTETLHLRMRGTSLTPATITLPEISVTATENALIATAFTQGTHEIRMAATEPHVQNLCEFLQSTGVHIEGVGTHFITVHGTTTPSAGEISVIPDYLEAGTFLIAGLLTDSSIEIQNFPHAQLDIVLEKLFEVGAEFSVHTADQSITTQKRKKDFLATSIDTGVFPKFPTDLHPQFGVLMTQCIGTSHIFETLFERKFAYLLELEKLGAQTTILNPHQFLIHGNTPLTGSNIASQDIRAGAAMILAALIAKGESEVSHIHYIDRGYQNLEKKLCSLGAKISRVTQKNSSVQN